MLNSAILRGRVYHHRLKPTQHKFDYPIAQWWLALDELEQLHSQSRLFSTRGFAPLWFRRQDYLADTKTSVRSDLSTAVRAKMSEIAGEKLKGRVFFLGNLRTFGLYFSPINCYFLQCPNERDFRYMLAEVSNTPWNERHYYLLDLTKELSHDKAFHVSPFNPIDMRYEWQIKPPRMQANHQSLIHLAARKGARHFTATLKLHRHELNPKSIRHVLYRYPVNTLTTVSAIYWQALRLWFKRTPIYDHP
ncbi:hypothetical protein PSI9734_00667 [Pseudidiomarina piscicola]|uniref:DUF1365 domain-containing protein n=1 Tax=Pseudidiomarina piscicola TaxID=2614830 RepID=A0A6S6WK76_9GAMM|nr:DUF1365 domain-containing protein [Pseudidiomarina piscicola]CAB0150100.1 hypothetical protein PSI9734_00667 [Pseudidiomarina piscicola]VZT39541.1 hypothetical protein PSI9734_00667 [Pseudomonas aeruginosa]